MFLDEDTECAAAIGTAFTIELCNNFFLVTSLHCVTGINPETKEPLSKNGVVHPEIMKVYFHKKGNEGEWVCKSIRLHDGDGNKFYFEHPLKNEIDIVCIPINDISEIDLSIVNTSLSATSYDVQITDFCSIVGFPRGLTAGGKYPIWKTGHLASDFILNWNGKKVFLVDATTREGMSGSPVYLLNSGIVKHNKNFMIGDKEFIVLLGVYSGRVTNDMDIGRVWKIEYLNDFIPQIKSENIRKLSGFSKTKHIYKIVK